MPSSGARPTRPRRAAGDRGRHAGGAVAVADTAAGAVLEDRAAAAAVDNAAGRP